MSKQIPTCLLMIPHGYSVHYSNLLSYASVATSTITIAIVVTTATERIFHYSSIVSHLRILERSNDSIVMHYVHTQACVIDVATRDDTISSLFDNKLPNLLQGKTETNRPTVALRFTLPKLCT